MKRFTAILLTLALLFSLCVSAAAADTGGTYEDSSGNTIAWSISNGTLTFSVADVPSGRTTVDGRIVRDATSVTSISSVVIGEGITAIDDYAFYSGYSALAKLTLPSTMKDIGDYAFGYAKITELTIPEGCNLEASFRNCSKLTSLTIGKDCTIGPYCFADCYGLTTVTIGSGCSLEKCAFFDDSALTSLTLGQNTIIKNTAFSSCSALTDLIIPEGCTLGTAAFRYCDTLKTVSFAGSVSGSIGSDCFYGCEKLQSIHLPEGVTAIGSGAFEGCRSLTDITLPSSLKEVGYRAFDYCKSLTGISLPEGLEIIEEEAFLNCSGLTAVTIPASVTSLGSYAFKGCTALASVTFLNTATPLGENCFTDTPWYQSNTKTENGLTLSKDGSILFAADPAYITGDYTVPATIRILPEGAFSGCNQLTSIRFAGNTTSLPPYFCRNCTALTKVTLPSSLTSLGEYAFSGCSSLTSCNLPAGMTVLNEGIFSGCSALKSIAIPDTVTIIYPDAFNETGLTSLTIPDSVRVIINAFQECSGLTKSSVTLGKGLTCLGYMTFNGCDESLAKDYISNYSINNNVFYLDTNLGKWLALAGAYTLWGSAGSSKVLPEGIYGIGSNAFTLENHIAYNLTMPSSLRVISTEAFAVQDYLTNINLNEGLQSIGMAAFFACPKLERITIPSTVTKIGEAAFAWSGLKEITFKGSAPEIFDDGSCGSNGAEPLFDGVTATVYYPADRPGWSEFISRDHGGSITWIPIGESLLVGDVNRDGKITLKDVSLLFHYITGQVSSSALNLAAAEVDNKPGINLRDVSALFKKI